MIRFLISLALISSSFTADAAAKKILLRGADLHTVANDTYDEVIKQGELLIEGDKIVALGSSVDPALIDGDTEVINVSGKRIYPGLILANSVAGLTEIESVRATRDYAEVGLINANARAQTAINPDSELLPVIRAQGVVALHVVPQNPASLYTGVSTLIYSGGWDIEEMAISPDLATVLQWPSSRLPDFLPPAIFEEAQKQSQANKDALAEVMPQAKRYLAARKANPAIAVRDLRLEALQPVIDRQRKLLVIADDVVQIREATEYCRSENLRCVLVGLADAWRVTQNLKKAQQELGMEFILGSPFALPTRRQEAFDAQYRNAGTLRAAGIEFAISGEGSSFSAPMDGYVAFNAAQYANFGLDAHYAVAALTRIPAKIFGAEKLGSLAVGKEASLLISSGDVLEIASKIEQVFIKGVKQDLQSKHTRLEQRYAPRVGNKTGDE